MKKQISNGVNKTTVMGIAIAIVVLSGIVWIARPAPYGTEGSRSGQNSQTDNTAPISQNSGKILSTEETNFDFGTISMAAGKVRRVLKVKNASNDPVVIGKMYTSCMCTTATLTIDGKRFGPYGMPGHGFIPKINETIDAEEEATVEIVFNPAAHGPAGVGRIHRTVTIENNGEQPLELGFTAIVTP